MMKRKLKLLFRWTWFLAFFLLLFMGSSKPLEQPAPIEINLSVLPGMQYSLARFHVLPGQKVTINFTNSDDMDHNLLILSPKSRQSVVKAAADLGALGKQMNYIPQRKEVLFSMPIVEPTRSKSITFTAPMNQGVYPYVCTLPGHGFLMYGAMYVDDSGKMPDLANDTHIPEQRRKSPNHPQQNHPYALIPPYYYRTYIQGASPAAIIVRLSDKLSICWDAGTCRLRFAWEGDFVDQEAIWKGHKDAKSKILGEIFYREDSKFPIEFAGMDPSEKPKFKGYRVLKDGYLEFQYQIGSLKVFETIKELKKGNGLIRHFRIQNPASLVSFNFTKTQGVHYYYQGKLLLSDRLTLSPERAAEFSVELKKE